MCPYYQELEELASQPEKLDEPEINEGLVSMAQSQLSCCAQARDLWWSGETVLQHTQPVFSLDLMPHRKPNKNSKAGGHLECSVSQSPFLFYDSLRHVAVTIFDVDPTRLSEQLIYSLPYTNVSIAHAGI